MIVSCGFVWEDFRKVDGFSVFDLPGAQGDLPGILRFRSCQFFVFLQFSELEWILLTSRFDQGRIDIIKEMILNPWSWYCAVPTVLPLQNWSIHTHKSHDPWRWRFPLQASQVGNQSSTVLLLQVSFWPLERSKDMWETLSKVQFSFTCD